jgi:hypothetical protein
MAGEKTDSEKLDAIASHLDSLHKRMDASEEERKADRARIDAACARMDASEEERKKADAARKDAEDKDKEEKAKADAARKDAEAEEERKKADKAKVDAAAEEERKKADAAARADATSTAALRTQVEELSRRMPAELPDDLRTKMVAHQTKAERVAQAFGDSAGAPRYLNGETEMQYAVRLANKYKTHSPRFKNADLSLVADPAVFAHVEDAIYADAMAAALNPKDLPDNVLIPRTIADATGRKITKFLGTAGACWNRFKMPYRFVKRWGDEKNGQVLF